MITNILTAEAIYAHLGVRDQQTLAVAHETMVQVKAKQGVRLTKNAKSQSLVAYINHGRWISECLDCHSGIAMHPDWTDGRCFHCGAVYSNVVFPAARAALEEALVLRPALENRNWQPPETVADLLAENKEHLHGLD